ncbi:hypothetical protein FHW23_002658 [Curtobacterium pusillum]|uniref:Uncharacterized protein n=1 Tax=Curtobacterium pusillum TaxID=69373 RepID=A0AAW3T959_9MICO|nr:hypothetical protein [Curtobacterium pusillum]MBA8991389.1 hypothetical protein [Curtobacterium pusillum]
MQNVTGVRAVSAAAVAAALVFGLRGLVGAVVLLQWDPPEAALLVGTVVGGIGAAVVFVAAMQARDRRALAIGVSTLAFALAWGIPGPIGSVLYVIAQGALIAFGVLTLRSARRVQRAFGWIVAVAAALWFVVDLLAQTGAYLALSQEALGLVLSIPGLLQAVAYFAAAVLVAVPLLEPVGRGLGALWSSAEVR